MNDIDDFGYNSDEEINKKQHARLLDEVLQLDKRQHVKKPSRTEPTTHVSEFNLVKTHLGKKNRISLNDLTKSLNEKERHVAIKNKVKSTFKEKTLPKPLEKPQAERLRRSIGFKETKDHLNKWNSIVEKNRVASQLVFPLNQSEIHFETGKKRVKNPPRYKSELDKELEKLEPVVETIVVEEKFPLNMEELVEQRKEMARLRARQSYQEAKARKQNKIKSKKYHKIQRKARLKEQIKEFEELQKTDPEAALSKLEQLEKTRVEERMSLRHRSTGQWAKNKQVRAKYDKESRQALAQQLSISRDLTQKMKNDSSDSENDEEIKIKSTDDSNPWTSQKSNEFTDFLTGYRKFWTEKNKSGTEDSEKQENKSNGFVSLDITEDEKPEENSKQEAKKKVENVAVKNNKVVHKNKNSSKTKKGNKSEIVTHCNTSWTVTSASEDESESIFDNKNVEDLFDDLEFQAQMKSSEKLFKLKEFEQQSRKRKQPEPDPEESEEEKSDLSFKPEKLRPAIDEALGMDSGESEDEVSAIKNTLETNATPSNEKQNIDPNKYISAKPVELQTKLPDIAMGDDDSEDEDQRAYISEAFADDDVVDEFNRDKKDVIDANAPKDIDLSLPGWGSWGGKNIQVSKRKKRRFVVKAPKYVPRRDDNKGNLIISENKDDKVKKHQVSEVPFPFTSVKDFEASIRAPIGDTFVPQTAFRRLIKPAIKTKKGAIIEPMTESMLLKQKFTKQGRTVNK